MKNVIQQTVLSLSILAVITSCGDQPQQSENPSNNEKEHLTTQSDSPKPKQQQKLFTQLSKDQTGIGFVNEIQETELVNTFRYVNAYNGGGVAIGDINNDALPDVFFTANTGPNRLYLNQGNLTFQDITGTSFPQKRDDWCTGVTMADVNSDGFLDIYVCRAFNYERPDLRENLLYINNGDMTFTEAGKKYGVNDNGFSNGATFFDYDLDGDLDLFVGNNPDIYNVDRTYSITQYRNPKMATSDHLYRNNGNGTFTDVTIKAGILNYGFMLGVIATDFNKDGYPDLYVANDHQEPDKYYVNNGDGTFTNAIYDSHKHTTYFSMGVDAGDINNDGLLDMVVADMMAEDNYRQKTQMASMDIAGFWGMVDVGYHYQYMRNALQVNNGNNTFSDIGYLAGVTNTDWSWATLFGDYDNDGYTDLFITNGYKKDIKDKDVVHAIDEKVEKSGGMYKSEEVFGFISQMTATPIPNKYYTNNGDYTFTDNSSAYGFSQAGFSNGAAYADLDADGDLDLIVNNINEPAFVYQNNANSINSNHYIRLKLEGEGTNNLALGAKVTLKTGDQIQYKELTLTRGFQSAVERTLHFGLGNASKVDEVVVDWPNGKQTIMTGVEADKLHTIHQNKANPTARKITNTAPKLFADISKKSGANFKHTEDNYDDFQKEILIPHRMSRNGPGLASGDVNGDGLDDFYIGGAKDAEGKLFVQVSEGKFKSSSGPFAADKRHEDVGALFFDADNDKDLDLYVVSGGNEEPDGAKYYQDRLYLNDGKGKFTKAQGSLPEMYTSGGKAVAADYDNDGDLDLLVTGRQKPQQYPYPAKTYILNNNNGKFTDVTNTVAPELEAAGMVTSAAWIDLNNDKALDLVLVGEWMPITFFHQNNGKFENVTASYGTENTVGWWNRIVPVDYDQDGDMDLVAGNLGLNYKYRVTEKEPLHIYCDDFDQSGTYDIVLGYYNQGVCYPVRGRQCSSEQMPDIKKKFKSYKEFAVASLQDVYGSKLQTALHYQAKYFNSTIIENQGNGNFVHRSLPSSVQFSAVQDILPHDFNGDGHIDLLIAGNWYPAEVETGRADAGTGLLLLGDGKGNWKDAWLTETGFYAPNDVRGMALLNTKAGQNPIIVVANNNDALQVFRAEQRSGNMMSMR